MSLRVSESERTYADNNNDIANMFNEYFVSIFSSDSGVVYEHSDHEHNIEFENITILEEEVLAVIMNLNNHKAHGSDNIPARLLKDTAVQMHHLFVLFLTSLCVSVLYQTSGNSRT